jgi:type VI secretion system Hcp family effector
MGTRAARRAGVAVGLGLMLIGLSAQPSGAEDAFAKITGTVQGVIAGDQPNIASIPGSKDTVQIFSTVFGLSIPQIQSGGGGTASGKPVPSAVALVKNFDRASPKLLRAAFTGEQLTIEITWFMAFQGTPRKTVTIRLDGALITNIEATADLQGNNASGFESVSVTYSKLTFSTPIIDPATGAVTGTSTVCLDVVAGKVC